MPTLSFRIRLLLAMMLVVITTSGITLVITQNKVQAAYERLFKETIESQIRYVPDEIEKRLREAKRISIDLARNQSLLSALAAKDSERLHQLVRNEISRAEFGRAFSAEPEPDSPVDKPAPQTSPSVSQPSEKLPTTLNNPANPKNRTTVPRNPVKFASDGKKTNNAATKALIKAANYHPRDAKYGFFLDASRNVLEPSSARAKTSPQAEFRKNFAAHLSNAIPDLRTIDAQQIGYIGTQSRSGDKQLFEIILTPMINLESKEPLGALVFAFPFEDPGEAAINAVSDIENGIWLDNTLYSRTISDTVGRELTRRLPEEIKDNEDSRPDFLVTIQDARHRNLPHRVFYTKLNPDSQLPPAYKIGLHSWDSALEAQHDLRVNVALFGSLALLGALILSLVIAHNFSIPLRQLVAGTTEIQRNNFNVRVPVRSRDELGQLADSFNKMAEGLALKEKYHHVLNMMADKEVAEQLVRSPLALGGETREVSVLFCDIRGFSALTENMPPQEIVTLLNDHMTALTRVVYENDGVVDKYVGDLVMALFGAPKTYGDDTFNAVRCAAQMIDVRKKLNEAAAHQVAIGVSVVTGKVIAGCMGSLDRVNYTVLGDRVNLGSRLCQQADRMELIIDDNTRNRLANRIEVEALPALKLKGLTESVQAYRVIEVKSSSQPPLGSAKTT